MSQVLIFLSSIDHPCVIGALFAQFLSLLSARFDAACTVDFNSN